MIFRQPLFLSILSGLLFACSWPETGSLTFPIFFAFVPLLILQQRAMDQPGSFSSRKLFSYSYLGFFLWNLLTTWWVKNASLGGAAMAVVFNALFMSLVFQLYHSVRKRLKGRFSFLILTSFWMAFEFLHLRWDLTWPWLTLGNVFAVKTWMVQWYEWTGVFGGTLWIFGVNFLIFRLLMAKGPSNSPSGRKGLVTLIVSLLALPIGISFLLAEVRKDSGDKAAPGPEILIIQPNVDPYNEKFNGSYKDQLDRMLLQAESVMDSQTVCVVFPETAIQENLWENDIERGYSVPTIRAFQKRHPHTDVLIGSQSAYQYKPGEKRSPTARKFTDSEEYYEDYNTALFFSTDKPVQVYHKSKFVPGVERMPFPALLKPLEKLAINMGGTTGSLCGQDERTVLVSHQNLLKIAPAICYESVFGDFLSAYIRGGANLICIITNDGWWGDTPGYRQHLDYARLRAIEMRRSIVRSANTGTSCFIDPLGKVTQATGWWKPAAIKARVQLNTDMTLYARLGDYPAWMALALTGVFLGACILRRFRKN